MGEIGRRFHRRSTPKLEPGALAEDIRKEVKLKTKLSLTAVPRNGNGKLGSEGALFDALRQAQIGCHKVVRGEIDKKGRTLFSVILNGSPDPDRVTRIVIIARQALGAHRVIQSS